MYGAFSNFYGIKIYNNSSYSSIISLEYQVELHSEKENSVANTRYIEMLCIKNRGKLGYYYVTYLHDSQFLDGICRVGACVADQVSPQ